MHGSLGLLRSVVVSPAQQQRGTRLGKPITASVSCRCIGGAGQTYESDRALQVILTQSQRPSLAGAAVVPVPRGSCLSQHLNENGGSNLIGMKLVIW